MKRRDLPPGTLFRYVCNPGNLYMVRDPDRENPTTFAGFYISGPNPKSTDWDLDVEIVTETLEELRLKNLSRMEPDVAQVLADEEDRA